MIDFEGLFKKLFFTMEYMSKEDFVFAAEISEDMIDFIKYYYSDIDVHFSIYVMFVLMYSMYVISLDYGGTIAEIENDANKEEKTLAEVVSIDKFRNK